MSFIEIFKIDELTSDFCRIQFLYSSLWENLLETVWTALNTRKSHRTIFLQPISDGWCSPKTYALWEIKKLRPMGIMGTN